MIWAVVPPSRIHAKCDQAEDVLAIYDEWPSSSEEEPESVDSRVVAWLARIVLPSDFFVSFSLPLEEDLSFLPSFPL